MRQTILRQSSIFRALILFFPLGLVVWPSQTWCQTGGQNEIASLYSLQGELEAKHGQSEWQPAKVGDKFFAHDAIRTKPHSRAGILFSDGIMVRLNENTSMELTANPSGGEQPVSLKQGEAYFLSREPKNFPNITTDTVSAAVRGTEFVVTAKRGQTNIAVLDGHVVASNKFGEVSLQSGEQALTKAGHAPEKTIVLKPANAVMWAVNYPPTSDESMLRSLGKSGKELQAAEQALASGQVTEAEQNLSAAETSARGTRDEGNVRALASGMRAIVALGQNDRSQAESARAASCSANPDSLSCALATSYVAQAAFDLKKAVSVMAKYHESHPNDTLALERLSELELADGHRNEAIAHAEAAVQAKPNSVRALTTLGFAELSRFRSAAAAEHFRSALGIDDTFGLAHLGLGLARIRAGELEGGRQDIMKAVAVEPNISVYRSYLGKAYFEEENERLAGHEYDRAIQLDPNDPTPYLYRAYNRLSNNEVVGALEDVEDSIARNDDRAVYRSSLLLDQDSAVRSAGLAEVFRSLGFNRAAEVEAVKAINRDYSNYSAHQFLADTYSTLELADSGVSERSVASLLSPISLNLFSSASTVGTNEYNALFDRPYNRTTIDFNGSTYHDFLVPQVSEVGRTENLGYLLNVASAYQNGGRDYNYDRDFRANTEFQYQLTEDDKLSLGAQFQDKSDHTEGATLFQQKFERYNYDLGYRHSFTPQAQFISQLTFRDTRDRLGLDSQRNGLLNILTEGQEIQLEDLFEVLDQVHEDIHDTRFGAQYLQDTEYGSLVFGGEQYYARVRREGSGEIKDDQQGLLTDAGIQLDSLGEPQIHAQSLYLYPTAHLTDWLDVTAGVKYANLETERREIVPFSDSLRTHVAWLPKLGATAYVTPALTLKASYFEGLRKSALEDVGGLEPTLVGGFNQVFNDFSGTWSRNNAIGFDYKLAKSTYLGSSYLRRHLIESDADTLDIVNLDLDQGNVDSNLVLGPDADIHYDGDAVNSYIYQVFSSRFVGTVEHLWQRLENTDPDLYQDIKLHRVASTVRYFDPSGYFAFVQGTWRDQSRNGSFFVEDGSNDFWLFDAGVGYRFPRRHGSLVLQVNNIFDKDFAYDQSLGIEDFVIAGVSGSVVFSVNF